MKLLDIVLNTPPVRWVGEKWAEADAFWASQLSIGEDDE